MNENSGSNKKLIISVVSIVLAIAIVVGAIWGINYFKTDGFNDSNGDGKNDDTGSTIVPGQTATKLGTYVDEYCEDGEGWIAASDMSKVLDAEVEIEYYRDWFVLKDETADTTTGEEVIDPGWENLVTPVKKIPIKETVSLDSFISDYTNNNYRYYKTIKFKFKYDQQLKITGIRYKNKIDVDFSEYKDKCDLGITKILEHNGEFCYYKNVITIDATAENDWTYENVTPKSEDYLLFKPNMKNEDKCLILYRNSTDLYTQIQVADFEYEYYYDWQKFATSNLSFKIVRSVF